MFRFMEISAIPIAGSAVRPLRGSDRIQLSCGPDGCSSNCCTRSSPVVLNPYEISLICRASGLSYEDLLDVVETDRVEGFPLVMLPRDPQCHFWTGKGCRIYDARPLACRLFPLGRVFHEGRSYIVLPERNLCAGLSSAADRTVADYLVQQDTAMHIEMADRWIDFVTDVERLPLPDRPVTSVAFHMLVYSPDAPPAPGDPAEMPSAPEERLLLRLRTAQEHLPRFLRPQ
jgi:Fe-S-cluster containining protein